MTLSQLINVVQASTGGAAGAVQARLHRQLQSLLQTLTPMIYGIRTCNSPGPPAPWLEFRGCP